MIENVCGIGNENYPIQRMFLCCDLQFKFRSSESENYLLNQAYVICKNDDKNQALVCSIDNYCV